MLRAHLICHTHWDREWYLTRMQFRTKLIRLVDGLLDLAEDSPDYVSFQFDGQTIALEDYLEIKPYNRDRLTRAIRTGKIIIGPWYILPDELLISGESHIRNYLTGSAVAAQFGEKMQIGYLPDSFGHPEQMPQILQGLGLDTIVFWRGAPNEMDQTEFYWQAPDKEATVLCVNMPNGYATAGKLENGSAATVERLNNMMNTLGGKCSTNVVLLMNGSDHLLAEKNIPDIIHAFNRAVTDKEIVFSTLENYLADLRSCLPADLKTFRGNLCYGDKTILLGGTLSTRMYLKQRNHTVQKKMERYLEPMICQERLSGGDFDFAGYQSQLWKLILENHPHDSICGCSVDALHNEMMTRFDSLEQLQDQLLSDTCDRLQAEGGSHSCDAQLLLFEPTQDQLPQYLEVDLCFDLLQKHILDFSISTTRELPGQLPPVPAGLRAEDENGAPIPCVLLSAQPDTYVMRCTDFDLPQIYHANRVRAALLLPGMSCGVHQLRFFRDDANAPALSQPDCVENAYYKVSFDKPSASFTVRDKKNDVEHTGVHTLIDMGDAGDEYTYSWPDQDGTYSLHPEDISTVERQGIDGLYTAITVRGVLRVPASLTPDRKARCEETVACPLRITAKLYQGIDRVDFETEIENLAQDHRLQVEFPVGTLCEQSSGSAAFSVTGHPIDRVVPPTWEEYPQSTALTHGFVDVNDGAYGLSLVSNGLAEYEAINRDGASYLRLTLLRCVGWLSLPRLNTRAINGGWQVETPGGQCMGRHRFQYSITYHEGSWQEAGTYAQADRALHPAYQKQAFYPLAERENSLAFLSQLPPLVRLSAVKPAEHGQGVILRFYHLGKTAETLSLPLPQDIREAYLTTLAEERQHKLDLGADHTMKTAIRPGQIISVELTR